MNNLKEIDEILERFHRDGYIFEFSCPDKPRLPTKKKSLFEKVIDGEYITEEVKSIGSISTLFTEIEIAPEKFFTESTQPFSIREVTHRDVTSKHFVDWFFKMDDWANITPKQFPFSMITHSDDIYVYGYFNGDKLDGIIRVDEYNDKYELSFFFVNKDLQDQGIGQYLFRYILNTFKNKKLVLYVYKDNSQAIHIYKKYGFYSIGTEYGRGYKPNSPHYIMQKDIPDSMAS